jgi:hypothetical protein
MGELSTSFQSFMMPSTWLNIKWPGGSDCIYYSKSVCFQYFHLYQFLISFKLNIYLFLSVCCFGIEFGLIRDMAFEN